MYISWSSGIDDTPLAFLLIIFTFSGSIGKLSSAGYNRKVPEYTEFLRNSSGKYNIALIDQQRLYPPSMVPTDPPGFHYKCFSASSSVSARVAARVSSSHLIFST